MMKKQAAYHFWVVLFLLIYAIPANPGFAQVSPSEIEYPHNHLRWYTIESSNFYVHYQEGSSRAAQVVSKIAEDIYEPVTTLYGHEPQKKVSIVLRDREDYSNGAAYFFDDKIEIWVPALDTPLRGTHPWLRNVITHEFTHIVQLGASMKRSQRFPAIYFQWLNYEDIRRPDVLYGFPNGIITMPFSSVSIPAWFAEGTAQYQRDDLSYDYWDSHRDMLLRTRILSDNYLDYTKMGTFSSKNSHERELVYNQGYDFTIYLANRFGEQILADLSSVSAEQGVNNFNHVFEKVTGVTGEQLHMDWISSRKDHYQLIVLSLEITESTLIENKGFFNFYPQYNQDESVFAYLTNRNRDVGRTSLLIQTIGSETTIDDLSGPEFFDPEQNYSFSHGLQSNPSIEFVSNRFSFSPDGKKIAYSRSEKNRFGETYQDIYIYDLDSKIKTQVTKDKRIQDPSWHPQSDIIAAVKLSSGTQNLVIIDLDTMEITPITSFSSGETVYTPVWSPEGDKIYFASGSSGNRNILMAEPGSGEISPVFYDHQTDFRDPWQQPGTNFLYFSSDLSGIFNIYRKNIETSEIEQITDVVGGAFMPYVARDSLFYSEYKSDGYKIAHIPLEKNVRSVTDLIYDQFFQQNLGFSNEITRNEFDGIEPLEFSNENRNADETKFQLSGAGDSAERIWRPYSEITTGLSIFPVFRFDNYTKPEGSNSRLLRNAQFGNLGQNLWRDYKAGAYFSSRDVTERFSIFGGALFGPGSLPADGLSDFLSPSRLNKLDRDLFLLIDYRGLPFIKRSWSPTISVEFYHQIRNVKDGITIEEFACTSCLPQEKAIDIRYSLWEANLFLRSKLNRWSLIELGATYSPYRVNTEGFFSDEFKEFIPGSTSEYFRGTTFSASYIADATIRSVHADIAPTGVKGSFIYRFQPGRLLQDFEISDGILSPVYSRDRNHSLELKSRFGLEVTDQTNAMITARTFSYLNNPEEYFYLDYTGGLSGLRSYPYFAVGGQRTFFARASLLHPVFEQINRQVNAYTLDKIFAHLYFETGNGWGGPLEIGNSLKSGVGAELRFSLNSYYLFPMKFFVSTTYGINSFNVTLPSQFISTSEQDSIQYGREFLFYFGLTFDFDFL